MIYLDNHATTPLDERVFDAMRPALIGAVFGNPSSTHSVGVLASRELEAARARLAALIPGHPRVVFTSGATEANALALRGRAPKGRRRHVVVSALEHPSVLENARELERLGCSLTIVRPDRRGLVDAEAVLGAATDETALVAVMAVNNEFGTVQPLARIAGQLRASRPRCHLHVDAAQAVGVIDLEGLRDASSISISGHKLHGPKGIGALLFRADCEPRAQLLGGGQEGGTRSGTQHVAGALGLVRAVELALEGWRERSLALAALRDRLVDGIIAAVPDAFLVGDRQERSPANALIAVPGLTSDVLVGALDQQGVIASTGSACHGADSRASEALRAIGHDPRRAGTVRFGLARTTSREDIEGAIAAFVAAVVALRSQRVR